MELMECGNLFHYLRSHVGRMPTHLKLSILHGVARGMLHLHQERVIHRDLASRNVLLTKKGVAKISDFVRQAKCQINHSDHFF
jgi:serine/threonine protein kinase